MAEENRSLTLVVFSNDMDKVLAAFMLATGAASAGMEVTVYFAFWGLNVLRKEGSVKITKGALENIISTMMPRGISKLKISKMNMGGIGTAVMKYMMKKNNVCDLRCLLMTAKELGVKLVACTTNMDVMGLKREEFIDGLEYSGLETYLENASRSNVNLFI